MQLWLKEVTTEYAMHKPDEEEIWPETTVAYTELWPCEIPANMSMSPDAFDLVWELQSLDGASMEMRMGGEHPRDYLERIALEWKEIATYRTHCPQCWEKMEGTQPFLGQDVEGHMAFHCPADLKYDDRFPREG